MFIRIVKPWLNYEPGDVVEPAPNEAEWLIRTGRGEEVKEEARAEDTAGHPAD